MQCNRLKTKEVVAAGDGFGDGSRPGRVLRDHDTIAPDPVIDGPVNQP